MKKIGILTLHYGLNYGGVLQTYALQKTLKYLGYDCKIIDRIPNAFGNYKYVIKRFFVHRFTQKGFSHFRRTYLNYKTSPIFSSKEMSSKAENFDTLIVGSDQVWRKGVFSVDGDYFMKFLENNNTTNALSYAASFGVDYWEYSEEETKDIKKYLSRFKAISVRESTGVELLKNKCSIESEHVLDPTLLADSFIYNSLIERSAINTKGKVVTYFLDWTSNKNRFSDFIRIKLKKEMFHILPEKKEKANVLKRIFIKQFSVYDWLKAIKDAEFVITDSFHGTVFSIIFNKQFVVIGNKERGLTRFTSILSIFNLANRLIDEDDYSLIDEILEDEINYSLVAKLVKKEKENSLNFFKKYL